MILIPEISYSIEAVCRHLAELRGSSRVVLCTNRWKCRFALVGVAERIVPACEPSIVSQTPACRKGQYIADYIAKFSAYPVDTRVSVLGHIQRGGIPSALDRLTAAAFGKTAVDLIAKGQSNQMVAWQNGQVVTVPVNQVCDRSPLAVDPHSNLVQTAKALGIYVGE